MNRHSITTRLILSFVAIIFLSIVLFMVVSNRVVYNRFSDLVIRSGANFSRRIVPILESYYEVNGSWEGIQDYFFGMSGAMEGEMGRNHPFVNAMMPRLMIAVQDERFILFDGDAVVFDSNPDDIQLDSSDNLIDYGTPVFVDRKQVGTFLVASTMGILNESQNIFITRVNRAFIGVGLVLILLALGVALWLSRSIVKPLQQVAEAANSLAKGNYDQRVVIDRNDELGDVATAFNQMASDLGEQEEIRMQMMADVAHELRTPLSILKIDLESMEDGLMDANPENIRQLQGEVTYLSNLVEDLRVLSMADAGDLRVEKTRIELNSLVREMIELQENSARERQIHITASYSNKEIFVLVDSQRISQVLINLLSNAIQHTPPDHEIFTQIEVSNQIAIVSITNTGSWILPADLEKIFDRFYRVEPSRNRENGGSGLGLSIARSLIEAHGGKIWADSIEGKSATFKFSLPIFLQKP